MPLKGEAKLAYQRAYDREHAPAKRLQRKREQAALAMLARADGAQNSNDRARELSEGQILSASRILRALGMTEERAFGVLVETALRAEKVQFATWQGAITDERRYPDHGLRQSAAIEILRHLGYDVQRAQLAAGAGQVSIKLAFVGPDYHAITTVQPQGSINTGPNGAGCRGSTSPPAIEGQAEARVGKAETREKRVKAGGGPGSAPPTTREWEGA